MSALWNGATQLLFKRNVNFSIRGRSKVPSVHNEPFLDYAPGSPERINLRTALKKVSSECPHIPLVVNGREIKTGIVGKQQRPDKHQQTICEFEYADHATIEEAIQGSLKAKKHWETMPIDERLSIFLKVSGYICCLDSVLNYPCCRLLIC
jgi:1-pyrroline-5-carboxylate dehydrogenase